MMPEPATYPGYRFPAEVIRHATSLYHLFGLSLRDIELILAERGVVVSHESIRRWCIRLAAPALIAEAMAVLRGKPRQSKAMWSRRAQEWQAKVDSGDPRLVAEVVRDLGRHAAAGEGSFSERRLFEAALDRLAGEVAAVEGMGKAAAAARITAELAAAAGHGADDAPADGPP